MDNGLLTDTLARPFSIPVSFALRNYSTTHYLQYLLRLPSSQTSEDLGYLAPIYTGRLTHRGRLAPLQSCVLVVKVRASQRGTYTLDGWQIESAVLEPGPTDTTSNDEDPSTRSLRMRFRYRQTPSPSNTLHVTIL